MRGWLCLVAYNDHAGHHQGECREPAPPYAQNTDQAFSIETPARHLNARSVDVDAANARAHMARCVAPNPYPFALEAENGLTGRAPSHWLWRSQRPNVFPSVNLWNVGDSGVT